MVQVKVSDAALLDLREISDYIIQVYYAPSTAEKIISGIWDAVRTLETFPELGKRVKDNFSGDWSFLEEDDKADIRALPSGKYWIVYDCRLAEELVEILAVIHQSRDMYRIFK